MTRIHTSMDTVSDLELTAQMKGLDEESKAIFRHREVLATILAGVVPEYRGYSMEEIMDFIEADTIGSREVSPGRTNTVIDGDNGEFKPLNEKATYFDVLFKAVNPLLSDEKAKLLVRLHIDIEPQKDYRPGYRIEQRGIYYLARAISSQLGLVTDETDYSALEKCYSIWICRDRIPLEERYTITSYSMSYENLVGTVIPEKRAYDLMTLVLIRLGQAEYEQENEVLEFLSLLMYPHKKNFLERIGRFLRWDQNEAIKEEVRSMSGLGESILQEGIEQGLEQGLERGIEQGREQGLVQGLTALVSSLSEYVTDFQSLYRKVIQNEAYAHCTEEEVRRYYK